MKIFESSGYLEPVYKVSVWFRMFEFEPAYRQTGLPAGKGRACEVI